MVGYDVDDDLDTARVSRGDHVIEVVKRAETWVDIAVVRHIIATIDKRRWVKRAQPDGLDTQLLKIVHCWVMPAISPRPEPVESLNERG